MKFRTDSQIKAALRKLNAAALYIPRVTAIAVAEVAAIAASASRPVVIYSRTPGLLAQRVFSDLVSIKSIPQSILGAR